MGTRGGGALSFDLSTRARDSRWERPLAPSSRREHVPFLAASDGGSVFASGISNSSTVHIWRPPTAIDAFPAAPIAVTARDWATCAAVSRAGDWAVVAGRSERLDAYRVGDGEEARRGRRHRLVRIPPRGRRRAVAQRLRHVRRARRRRVRRVRRGRLDASTRRRRRRHSWRRRRVALRTSVVTAVDVARDAGLIIVGADDGRTFFFDARAGTRPCTRANRTRWITPRRVASPPSRREATGLDFSSGRPEARISSRVRARLSARARTRVVWKRWGVSSRRRRFPGIRSRGGDGRARTRRERTARRVVRVVGRRRGGGRRGRRVDRRRRAAGVRRGVRGDATRRGDARGGGGRRKSSEKGVPLEMVRGVMARRRNSAKERDGEEQYL